jgi:hypothetical protein
MKALGCQSDKEVLQLICGNEESYHSDFAVNLEEAAMYVSVVRLPLAPARKSSLTCIHRTSHPQG